MNELVQKVLVELGTNNSVKSEPLVKMLVESTNKSIALGENIAKVYANLKAGLAAINEQINKAEIGAMLHHFNKLEETPEARIAKIAKEINFSGKIAKIKQSGAYSNPLVKTKVDQFEMSLNAGTPDFVLGESFINTFNQYSYDTTVKSCVESTVKYLAENRSKLLVLGAIYQMDSMRSPIYAGVSSNLKDMFLNESYSADILKLKYGTTLPLISSLINELRLVESAKTGAFTLGEGNYDTKVNDLIAPAIKTEDGIIICTDNRFLSIREAKGLTGKEVKIHHKGNFKITDIDPNYVKSKYAAFYGLCEAYATLGFAKSEDGLGVESKSLRNFTLSFKLNEQKGIDLYINEVKADSKTAANVSESLALMNNETKAKVLKLVEGADSIFNFEFIKEISNDRRLSESLVLKLNESFLVCDKINAYDRVWTQVNENQLYEFFKNKFNYDISSIFKIKISEQVAEIKAIEENKEHILKNVQKLELSIKKLDEACENPDLGTNDIKKLEAIKESIEKTITGLKEEYVRVDLLKKK